MKSKGRLSKHFQHKIKAGVLAILMAFATLAGSVSPQMTVNAGSAGTLADVKTFGYTGSVQTFTAPLTGKYTIEMAGGAGGNAGHYSSQPLTYLGGRGGLIKFTIDLRAGQNLYMYVGASGRCDGDYGSTPAASTGVDSHGGNAYGSRAASGGAATEIRIDGTSRSNIIAVAGGGGGANQYRQGSGVNGLDAATATAGNNRNSNGTGSSAANNGAGGGGGYIGGTAGTTSSPAHGGSNYIAPTLIVNTNGVNPQRSDGYIIITRLSSYQLMVNPAGGVFKGSDKVTTYTLDTTYTAEKSFGFNGSRNGYGTGVNGSPQAYTIPYTGYYYMEAAGGSGGSDATSGGYGGYVKAYTYLTAGQTVYVNVGGHGGDNVPMSETNWGNAAGWNGGAIPGNGSGGYSGGGGGSTSIATANRGVLQNFVNTKNEVLVVAGGGSGGSASSAGEGGTVLYAGTGTSSSVVNGASVGRLAYAATTLSGSWSYFGVGQNPGTDVDGGGGGGGWVGGRRGLDAAGNSSGGGASFVNTSNNSICVGLVPSNNAGNGWAKISYKNDMVVLPNPTREGYVFKGWAKSGPGNVLTTVDGQTAFTYSEGLTTLTAMWEKIPGYGTLNINPNGGYYDDTKDVTVVNKPANTQYGIAVPYNYGYAFTGWVPSGDGTYANSVYTFSTGTGNVTAGWTAVDTTLTIDPNGGIYEGSTGKILKSGLRVDSDSAVVSISTPTRVGYNFQYWEETTGSDGYISDDGWHAGTKSGYLKAVWEPITYTVHYEPNTPAGLTLRGTQPDQTHTYDQSKALATNAEYNETNGYSIDGVKFLWWNTKPDGSGTTYTSGQVVKNLTSKQGDVITLYAQWMVKYTVEHYKQNLDGSYTLADTDEYRLIPLTMWTAPLHDYPGWSKPVSNPFTVGTSDTTLKFYYPLIHYKLTYDTQGGEWYEEQPDGTWISVQAPPSEYTVLTPDIHVTRPDKVGYTFLGWTGTDVNSNTLDVVIPKGSLGDRSYVAHWEAQAYDVEVPVSVLFSVGYEGTASGVFDQNGDENYTVDGHLKNNSLFPVQVTSVTLENEGDFVFTHDKTLDVTHSNIMNWRLDAQNGAEWNQYAPELEGGIDTKSNDIFWMAQNGKGSIKLNVNNAWAIHDSFDIKDAKQIGRIVWTFDIGHRNVVSRAAVQSE